MPFTSIAQQLLRVRARRGGGLASYFGGDVSAVEIATPDQIAVLGSIARVGSMSASEFATRDSLAGLGSVTAVPTSPGMFFHPNTQTAPTVNGMFSERNNGPPAVFSTEVALPGRTRSVLIPYTQDEDGIDLYVYFAPTLTLFCRKWMYFDSLWAGHWPVGLKTARYFTSAPGADDTDYAYMSEKYIWQVYPPPDGDGDPSRLYGWGLNHACFNNDRVQRYTESMIFRNGLPYIRTGRFYCFETYIEMNSADNVPDGKLHCRVDGVPVKTDNNVAFRASARVSDGHAPRYGTHWQKMWFGGNISTTTNNNFPAGQTLKRFEDEFYLSTTPDWEIF